MNMTTSGMLPSVEQVKLTAVTPLVVGGPGAANGPSEGFRVPSIRGCLRFWYRAGAGAVFSGEHLAEEEASVMGGQGHGQTVLLWADETVGGRVTANLRMNNPNAKEVRNRDGQIVRVLRVTRPASASESTTSLTVTFPAFVHEEKRRAFWGAFDLLAMLGGIGGRWRRGFGSFEVTSPLERSTILKGETIEERAALLQGRVASALKTFTPSSGGTGLPRQKGVPLLRRDAARVYLVEPSKVLWSTWDAALDGLRTAVYGPMKTAAGCESIGSGGEQRVPSPVVFQVKRVAGGSGSSPHFVGVLIAFWHPNFQYGKDPWALWDSLFLAATSGVKHEEIALP